MRSFCMLFATVFCLAAAAGCAGSGKKAVDQSALNKLNTPFETTAHFVYKDMDATAVISRETPTACTVTFASPEALQDMVFEFRKDEVDIRYKGLAVTIDPDSMPGNAAARIAISAINKALQEQGVQLGYGDGVLEVTGALESGQFYLKLDSDNGNLLKLSVPSEELEIEFLNFTFLE